MSGEGDLDEGQILTYSNLNNPPTFSVAAPAMSLFSASSQTYSIASYTVPSKVSDEHSATTVDSSDTFTSAPTRIALARRRLRLVHTLPPSRPLALPTKTIGLMVIVYVGSREARDGSKPKPD